MQAADIQRAIIADRWLRSFVMPNYAPVTWWENDVFEVSKAGYWTEFEVKLSVADYKADARKCVRKSHAKLNKHELLAERSTKGPSRFYFVMPVDLACKVEVPEWAGLIVAVPTRWRAPRDVGVRIERKAPRLHGEKVNPHVIARAKETCYYRLAGNYMLAGLEMGQPACDCPEEDGIDEWGDVPAPAYPELSRMCLDAIKKQGRPDAEVSLVVPGKWAERKRLCGRRGPFGRAIAEYEDACLCVFNAIEVLRYVGLTLEFEKCSPSA